MIADRIVEEALRWVGTPYRHQGSIRGVGCDCVGLLAGVWRGVYGDDPERPSDYSADWAETGVEELLLAAVRRLCVEKPIARVACGDVLLFRWRPHLPAKHAGILVAAGRFVHAYEGCAVSVSALVPQWRRRLAGVFAFPEPISLA